MHESTASIADEGATSAQTGGADAAFALRQALYERFPVAAVAVSIDGAVAGIYGPLDLGIRVGDLVVIDIDDADRWVAQVRSLRLIEREAAEVEVAGDGVLGVARARPLLRLVGGEAAILGRLTGEGFAARSGPVFGESRVRLASPEETAAVFGGEGGVEVGTLLTQPAVVAGLRAKGFGRHTFLCGQSGSGKTYTTGVLLEQLLISTDLPIVVIDPNSDYVRLGHVSEPAAGSDRAAYASRAADVVVARARGAGGDVLLAAHFSDLSLEAQASILRLDAVRDLGEYAALRDATASLEAPYAVEDVIRVASGVGTPDAARVVTRLHNLGVVDWGLWCREGEPSLVGSGLVYHRCVVLDVGSLDTPREAALVGLVVMRALWERRRDRRPVLIVVDEAHNAFPTAAEDEIGRALMELGVLVAGEGRKFGLHLLLCTQRPAKLHPNVVSQCDNLALLRVNSAVDLAEIARTFSHVPSGMVERAGSLHLGEVLVAGPIAPIPLFMKTRTRISEEGGSDVSTAWTTPAAARAGR